MKLSLQDVLRGIAKTVGAGGVVSIASECKVNLELKSTYSWLLLLASCTASQLATVATLDPTPIPCMWTTSGGCVANLWINKGRAVVG